MTGLVRAVRVNYYQLMEKVKLIVSAGQYFGDRGRAVGMAESIVKGFAGAKAEANSEGMADGMVEDMSRGFRRGFRQGHGRGESAV